MNENIWSEAVITIQLKIKLVAGMMHIEESANELSTLKAYSNHSANLVEDWMHDGEDDVWK